MFFIAANISETITDEVLNRHYGPDVVVAEIIKPLKSPVENEGEEEGSDQSNQNVQFRISDVNVPEKLEKFVEDVK